MIIERRSILKGLVALVVAPAIVKVASLMPVNAALQPGWPIGYGNSYLTINDVAREAVRLFTNNNAFIKQIDEQYEAEIKFMNGEQWTEADGAKIGSQLRIRLPNDYMVTDGPGLSVQEPVERGHDYIVRCGPAPVEFQVSAPLALAAAAVAIAPAVLKTPVTRRFWKLPQHSAASQED